MNSRALWVLGIFVALVALLAAADRRYRIVTEKKRAENLVSA